MRISVCVVVVLLLAFSRPAMSQLTTTKIFSSQTNLCSKTIILDSLGYFFIERGCESASYVTSGRYNIGKDQVIDFNPLPVSRIEPIKKIVNERVSTDSFLTITFYDRYNGPVDCPFILLWGLNDKMQESRTGDSGKLILNRFLFRNVTLRPLVSMYNEVPGIPVRDSSIAVYFGLPKAFLHYSDPHQDDMEVTPLKLKVNGLYDVQRDSIVLRLVERNK